MFYSGTILVLRPLASAAEHRAFRPMQSLAGTREAPHSALSLDRSCAVWLLHLVMGITKIPNTFAFKPTTRPETCWRELSYEV